MNGRDYWLSGAGEEAVWTWAAAASAFIQGNWIATILCCHAVCERSLAGRFGPFWMDESDVPNHWEHMGLGRLLGELEKQDRIEADLAARVRRMSEYRKPFGHWKNFDHPTSLYTRARVLLAEEVSLEGDEAVFRVLVDDATRAIQIAVEVLYGEIR